jgi:hypothetical protein
MPAIMRLKESTMATTISLHPIDGLSSYFGAEDFVGGGVPLWGNFDDNWDIILCGAGISLVNSVPDVNVPDICLTEGIGLNYTMDMVLAILSTLGYSYKIHEE